MELRLMRHMIGFVVIVYPCLVALAVRDFSGGYFPEHSESFLFREQSRIHRSSPRFMEADF
jgi:hypothetical protein